MGLWTLFGQRMFKLYNRWQIGCLWLSTHVSIRFRLKIQRHSTLWQQVRRSRKEHPAFLRKGIGWIGIGDIQPIRATMQSHSNEGEPAPSRIDNTKISSCFQLRSSNFPQRERALVYLYLRLPRIWQELHAFLYPGKLSNTLRTRAVAKSSRCHCLSLWHFHVLWKQAALWSSIPLFFWCTC